MSVSETWFGEALRWYLKRGRHPFKNYLVGHYWPSIASRRLWVRYDERSVIGLRLDDYVQQRIFFDGYYEQPLITWLRESLRPTDVFWDVGAHIGSVTLVAASRCRQVVSFEPDPRSLSTLNENLRKNRLTNVEVIPSALGASVGVATLYQSASANTGMTSLLANGDRPTTGVRVNVTRADDLISRRPELAPTIMKIDVEGGEHLVLGGATALLRMGHLRAIVFEDRRDADNRPTNAEAVFQLEQARYRIEPFALSEKGADDDMFNFLATRSTAA